MTVKEAAKKWGLSTTMITHLCDMDRIAAVKLPVPGHPCRWEILQEEKPNPRMWRNGQKRPPLNLAMLPDRQKRIFIWGAAWKDCNLSVREIARRLGLTSNDVRQIFDEELINRLHGGVNPLEER